MEDDALFVHEMFLSIQGESTFAGRPCAFIRLSGCNLHCTYCDTRQALTGGTPMARSDILAAVAAFGVPLVEVTGGEPLVQPNTIPLLRALCDTGYEVLLETNGATDIATVDPRVVRIMDLKTPGSGQCQKNLASNLAHLTSHDEVKFVLVDRRDYEWMRDTLRATSLPSRVRAVLASSAFGTLSPRTLSEWVLEDRLPVRVQLQLHKYIWDPNATGV